MTANPSGRVGLAALALLAAAGCGSSSPASSASAGAGAAVSGEVTVLAAASLQGAFTTITRDFERAHPEARVTLSFGPSSGLATQIVNDAPADVFAAASATTMRSVIDAGKAKDSAVFAVNTMAIAVPPGNPAGIGTLRDLKDGTFAVCQPDVPCGAAAGRLFERAGISPTPVSEEVDVKAVLTKVTLGEVDAGIVYATDVRAAGDKVEGVAIPADQNTTTDYPIAALATARNPQAARAFAAYVLSEPAQRVLRAAGFGSP